MFVSIVLLVFLMPVILTSQSISCFGTKQQYRLKNINNVWWCHAYIILWFVVAIVLSSTRGDFSADYNSYVGFYSKLSHIGITDFIFSYNKQEYLPFLDTGYRLINVLCGYISQSHIFMFFAVAVLTLIPVGYLTFRSCIPWMTILLYYTCGAYWASFNTVRTYLAASMLIFSYKYLVQRRFLKYLIIVLIAASIHDTAILMVPMYFIINVKFSIKRIVILSLACLCISFFLESGAMIFNRLFHVAKNHQELLELLYRRKSKFISLLFPLICCLISFYLMSFSHKLKRMEINDREIRILYNGTILFFALTLLQIRSAYFSRIAAYFYFFFIQFVPTMIYGFPITKIKKILMLAIFCMGIFWDIAVWLNSSRIYYFSNLIDLSHLFFGR